MAGRGAPPPPSREHSPSGTHLSTTRGRGPRGRAYVGDAGLLRYLGLIDGPSELERTRGAAETPRRRGAKVSSYRMPLGRAHISELAVETNKQKRKQQNFPCFFFFPELRYCSWHRRPTDLSAHTPQRLGLGARKTLLTKNFAKIRFLGSNTKSLGAVYMVH